MKPCVLYFSRTGNTKRLAEAIAQSLNAPVFELASFDPAAVESCDLIFLGTPVEGFRPAKETVAYLEHLPKTEGKKVVLFCTYALYKGSTFKKLEKELANKGYKTVLKVAKKGMKPDLPADFSDVLSEIKKVAV